MDYSQLAALSDADRLTIAQGRLRAEFRSHLILVAPLSAYEAAKVLRQKGDEPSGSVGIYQSRPDTSAWMVCFADWRELGIFQAREPMTETEKKMMSFDWQSAKN